MEGELLKAATAQGIWAILSVVLIVYIVRAQEKRDIKQEEREANYQKIIYELIDKLQPLESIKDDVCFLKESYLGKKEEKK